MSFANDPQFQNFVKTHKHVVIPNFGTVFIMNFTEPFPPMARRLSDAEGQQYLTQLKTILDEWSIVALTAHAISGSGYNWEIKQSYGKECGQGFIAIQGEWH